MRQFVCKECGKDFATRENRDRTYCSKSCKAKAEFHARNCTRYKEVTYDIDTITGCWNCTSHVGNRNYPMIKRNGIRTYLSRLAYTNKYGQIPDGLQIRHKCDNPRCINPDHLETGTIADNMRDKVERGRQIRGSEMPIAKLNEDKVREIRKSSDSRRELAKRYNVSISLITSILKGRLWKHIEMN